MSGIHGRLSRGFRFAAVLCSLFLAGCDSRPASNAPTQAPLRSPAPPLQPVSPSSTSGANAPAGPFPRTLTDATGQSVTIAAPPQRIVSLAPSNTELLFALNLGDKVVLDTTSCDYPPEAKQKPHLDALKPDIEPILAANPDLVVAVQEVNAKLIGLLRAQHIPTFVLNPHNVQQTYEQIGLLARAVGQDAQGDQVVKAMRTRIEAVKLVVDAAAAKTPGGDAKAPEAYRPRVLIMYGDNPIYTTGPDSFISDLIAVAGGFNVIDKPIAGNIVSPENVIALQPDVIICSPDLQTRVKRIPGFATGVPAVVHNRFFTTSPQATLERPSPRLAQAAEELARFLHPNAFPANPGP